MRIIKGTVSDCIEKTRKQIDELEPARNNPSGRFEELITSIKINIDVLDRVFEEIAAAKEKANDFLVHQALCQEVDIRLAS